MLKFFYSEQSPAIKRKLSSLNKKFDRFYAKVSRTSFFNLPFEKPPSVANIKTKFKTLAIIGIGGSSLGAKALAEALRLNNVIFLDNTDPDFIHNQLEKLNLKNTLFLVISKSGNTIEIISLLKIIFTQKLKQNFAVITDNPSSELGLFAKTHALPLYISSKDASGRFSVLSNIGMLAAELAGTRSTDFFSGALSINPKDAYEWACRQYLHYHAGKNISVLFAYAESLSAFADWHIQLLSESIGKTNKIGLTPAKAIGVKDQHSQLQLFLDGPPDKFFIFLKPQKSACDLKIPGEKYTLENLFSAEYEGVKSAFAQRDLSFAEISFEKISAKTLGALFYLFELHTAFLGMLFNINYQNQPAVELSKKLTKQILQKY